MIVRQWNIGWFQRLMHTSLCLCVVLFFCVFNTFSPGCLEFDHGITECFGCQYQQATVYIERLIPDLRDIPRSTLYHICIGFHYFSRIKILWSRERAHDVFMNDHEATVRRPTRLAFAAWPYLGMVSECAGRPRPRRTTRVGVSPRRLLAATYKLISSWDGCSVGESAGEFARQNDRATAEQRQTVQFNRQQREKSWFASSRPDVE